MRALITVLYVELISRLATLIRLTKEHSMTDTDTATAAPVDQSQTDPTTTTTTSPPAPAPADPAPDVSAEPKCTATANTSDGNTATPAQTPSQNTPSERGGNDSSPFIQTAMAAAHLIEQLRKHPESHGFLQALLKCLEPPKSNSSND